MEKAMQFRQPPDRQTASGSYRVCAVVGSRQCWLPTVWLLLPQTTELLLSQYVVGDRLGGCYVATPTVDPGAKCDAVGRGDLDGENNAVAIDTHRRTIVVEFADLDSDAAFDPSRGCRCRILETQLRRMKL